MTEDESARRTALALIAQYGVDAEVIAMLRAAEYAALGDLDGLAQWDDILACVARLLAVPSDPHQLN
ncbi:hypothetical protein [Phenylobacterium aquaticum]|uniref:hypothetical protein n=1 Tax=Phenylobacterium aquaticum TaxID=1763816 RepID=UPI0026F261A0|nr:hypothetical protein [Phenylobacterium aquaticum]